MKISLRSRGDVIPRLQPSRWGIGRGGASLKRMPVKFHNVIRGQIVEIQPEKVPATCNPTRTPSRVLVGFPS